MKALKYIGFFVIGFVVLILALFCALVLLFNPNNYKAEIQNLVKEKANVELNIEGDINWTFYPWLGLSIQNTSAASLDTPDRPFAKIKELDLSVKLLPLFTGKIQMNDVNLDGLVVDLQKDEHGRTNWEKVGEVASDTTNQPTEKPQQSPKKTNNGGTIDLNINSVTINNTKVSYKDLKLGHEYIINNVHLSTGVIRVGQPVIIKLGANFRSNQPKLTTDIQLQGQLVYNLEKQLYQVKGLDLNSRISGEIFQGKTATFSAKGDLMADLKANTAAWSNLYLTLDELKVVGNINATNIRGEIPEVKGNLLAETFNLYKTLKDIGITLPAMADKQALTQVSFSTNLVGSTKAIALNDLKIKLDNTNLTGNVAITDLARQAIKLQIKGDSLNVDNYLPPESKQTAQNTSATKTNNGSTATSNKAIWDNEPMFDPKVLRNLDIDAAVSMQQVVVKKLRWENFEAKLTAKNGLLNIQNVGGKLFTGTVNVKGSLNASSATPQINLQPTISNLPIEKLMDQADKKLNLRGTVSLNGNLHSLGLSQASMVRNLGGTVNFVVNNGALIGENLEYQVCKGVALVRGKKLTSRFDRTETKFQQLKASININNGLADNQNLLLAIAGFETKGKGTFNLVTMEVDYHIGLSLKGEQDISGDPACKVNKDVTGIEFPLICKGPVLNNAGGLCGIDENAISNIAVDYGKNRANQALDKERDKLQQKLDKKLGDKNPALKGAAGKILKGIKL